jgi:4-aminobutyrate aminotransferase-like enzyme
LQSGVHGESITIAPPPVIGAAQLDRAFDILADVVREPLAA